MQLGKNGGIGNYVYAALGEVATFFVDIPILGDILLGGAGAIGGAFVQEFYEDTIIPVILYSPATIFYNKVPALDVNFINPSVSYAGGKVEIVDWGYRLDENGNVEGYIDTSDYEENEESADPDERFKYNTAYQLRDTIAGWYNSLRDVAIVALLSVLVYVAIRIILSSTAGETAKYKEMLKDWVLALCMLFVMHYLMSFLLSMASSVTDIVDTSSILTAGTDQDIFMTNVRFGAQEAVNADGEDDGGMQFGYTIIYLVLVFYTVIFTWKYLMRLIYLAFLTMIAPLVAVTYPIDKISDGKAQAFTMWFREYLYNVLLQPMHMILYTILITSVADFAEQNMIYACVAIGFLLPAEKLVKSMFGFNKAEGGGLSAAITGGALFGTMSSLTKNAFGQIPGSGKSSGSGGSGGSGSASPSKVHYSRQADKNAPKGLSGFGGSGGSGGPLPGGSGGSGKKLGRSRTKTGAGGKGTGSGKTGGGKTTRRGVPSLLASGVKGLGRGTLGVAKFGGRTIRGAATMGGRFVGKAIKPVAKIGLTASLGAAGAMVGMAAGLASDDYTNVATLGATGAGVGAFAGNKAYDGIRDVSSLPGKGVGLVKDSVDDFKQGYYGKAGYGEYVNKKADKEWAKDDEVVARFQQLFGKDYKKRLKDAKELRKAGVTEQEELEKALKLMEKNKGLTTEQAANIMDFSKGLTRKDLLNNETRDNLWESAKNMTGDPAQADKVMDLVDQKFNIRLK